VAFLAELLAIAWSLMEVTSKQLQHKPEPGRISILISFLEAHRTPEVRPMDHTSGVWLNSVLMSNPFTSECSPYQTWILISKVTFVATIIAVWKQWALLLQNNCPGGLSMHFFSDSEDYLRHRNEC
jgi:hypothetical protein